MTRGIRVGILWLAGVMAMPGVVSGAAPPAPPASPSHAGPAPVVPVAELLGNGDSVRVTVFQNPDLTTEARISERGSINFPLIGDVVIGGLTPEGAAARIAD